MSDTLIRIRGLSFSRGDRVIFDNIDMDIPRSGITAIMGPSGTGKTTLLKLIGGQLRPDAGSIEVDGRDELRIDEEPDARHQPRHREGRDRAPVGRAGPVRHRGLDQDRETKSGGGIEEAEDEADHAPHPLAGLEVLHRRRVEPQRPRDQAEKAAEHDAGRDLLPVVGERRRQRFATRRRIVEAEPVGVAPDVDERADRVGGGCAVNRCPGQDSRRITAEIHQCPNCGDPIEIFSDEQRRRCPACKTMVFTDWTPTCVKWCQAARECLGPERYEKVMKLLQEGGE